MTNKQKEFWIVALFLTIVAVAFSYNMALGILVTACLAFLIKIGNDKIEDDKRELISDEEIEKELDKVLDAEEKKEAKEKTKS